LLLSWRNSLISNIFRAFLKWYIHIDFFIIIGVQIIRLFLRAKSFETALSPLGWIHWFWSHCFLCLRCFKLWYRFVISWVLTTLLGCFCASELISKVPTAILIKTRFNYCWRKIVVSFKTFLINWDPFEFIRGLICWICCYIIINKIRQRLN
jgi:hypothetical protein